MAYLTFDQPVTTLADISSRKIVAAELRRDPEGRQQGQDAGGVRVVNNRRTTQRDDDLTLFTPGPVYYQEKIGKEPDKEPHIWTAEAVRLRDEQTRPNPTEIVAIGMDVYLATESPDKKAEKTNAAAAGLGSQDRSRSPSRSQVDSSPLRRGHVPVDGRQGRFPGRRRQEEAGPAGGREKAQLQIKTQGPFFYDVTTDKARFDISQHPSPHPNNVMVRRTHVPDTACDQLVCDHLELQFERKSAKRSPAAEAATAPANDRAVEIAIQTAHAWGSQVTLVSDLEGLTAFGNDLTYNAVSRETLLKGSPEMVVMKDGNEIYARELVMQTKEEGKQQAQAKGPGHLRIFDRTTGQRTIRASWNETLVSAKEGEYDILILTGQAKFEDQEHDQDLQADQLKVWLVPSEPAAAGAETAGCRRPASPAPSARGRRPGAGPLARDAGPRHRAAGGVVQGCAGPRGGPACRSRAGRARRVDAADGPHGRPAAAARSRPRRRPAAAAKAKKPVDLSARSVVAHVLRVGSKSELEKLWCEGHGAGPPGTQLAPGQGRQHPRPDPGAAAVSRRPHPDRHRRPGRGAARQAQAFLGPRSPSISRTTKPRFMARRHEAAERHQLPAAGPPARRPS